MMRYRNIKGLKKVSLEWEMKGKEEEWGFFRENRWERRGNWENLDLGLSDKKIQIFNLKLNFN